MKICIACNRRVAYNFRFAKSLLVRDLHEEKLVTKVIDLTPGELGDIARDTMELDGAESPGGSLDKKRVLRLPMDF